MTGAAKISTCPGCNKPKLRREYCTKPDGKTPYPRCRDCGNGGKLTKFATKTCTNCGEVKRITKAFVKLEGPGRKQRGYTDDCRECRDREGVRQAAMAEKAQALWEKRKAKEVTATVRTEAIRAVSNPWENLGLEWSGRKAISIVY